MTPEKPSIMYVLQSRKFWMAVVGFVLILVTAITQGQELDANTIVNGILGIVAAYIGSVALEDGLTNRNAGKTTIETPSENVQVTTTEAKPVPPVGRMGL
jgi:hypothetical protein